MFVLPRLRPWTLYPSLIKCHPYVRAIVPTADTGLLLCCGWFPNNFEHCVPVVPVMFPRNRPVPIPSSRPLPRKYCSSTARAHHLPPSLPKSAPRFLSTQKTPGQHFSLGQFLVSWVPAWSISWTVLALTSSLRQFWHCWGAISSCLPSCPGNITDTEGTYNDHLLRGPVRHSCQHAAS